MGTMPRTLTKTRPSQGAHLAALRQAAGFSQSALAAQVGETQQNIAFWEQSDKPPRSDVLPKLARVLGVSVEELLNAQEAQEATARKSSSAKAAAKVRRTFEEVSTLPRPQQQRILDVVQAMLQAQRPQNKATPNS
jgi:transcriptional regulator with XRE-family HTH domain